MSSLQAQCECATCQLSRSEQHCRSSDMCTNLTGVCASCSSQGCHFPMKDLLWCAKGENSKTLPMIDFNRQERLKVWDIKMLIKINIMSNQIDLDPKVAWRSLQSAQLGQIRYPSLWEADGSAPPPADQAYSSLYKGTLVSTLLISLIINTTVFLNYIYFLTCSCTYSTACYCCFVF